MEIYSDNLAEAILDIYLTGPLIGDDIQICLLGPCLLIT